MLIVTASAIGEVETTIRAICEIQDEDGIVFHSESVEGARIKGDDEYDGVRIKLLAELSGQRRNDFAPDEMKQGTVLYFEQVDRRLAKASTE